MNEPFHTFQFGLVPCSTCTIPQVLDEIRRLLLDRSLQPRLVLEVNAHIYNVAAQDPQLARVLNSARIVMADGMSVVWAARLFGERIPERCNETEAFRAFLRDASMPASTAVLAGCTEEEARAAAVTVNAMSSHLRVTHTASGFLSEPDVRAFFRNAGDVDFILLGHSSPVTQRVAEIAVQERPEAIVWGIGAGTIRIFAGTLDEAPPAWRHAGLQWLHRLIKEPRQLWKRYLIGNPLFVARIVRAAIKAKADG